MKDRGTKKKPQCVSANVKLNPMKSLTEALTNPSPGYHRKEENTTMTFSFTWERTANSSLTHGSPQGCFGKSV